MADERPARDEPGTRRELLIGFLHLAVLWAFAVVQPLLDLLGDNPEFFVARGNTTGDIVLVAIVLTVVPPLLMIAVEALAQLIDPRPRRALHLLFVGGLAAMLFLQVLGAIADGPAAVLIVLALALGAGTAALYVRTEWLRSVLTTLSPAPILFLALFLFFSDVKELVLPEDEVEAAEIAVPGRTPVVLILLDEAQGTVLMDAQGRIDRTLFPNFAELAAQGSWYPNASTEADLTPRAMPAVVTGSYPSHDDLPTAADHPDSLFTLLGGEYRMHVAEPVTTVCPESLCGERARPPASERLDSLASDLRIVYEHLLLPESLEDSLPAVDENFEGFGEEAGGGAEDELTGAGDAGEPEPATPVPQPAKPGGKQKGAVESGFDAPNEAFFGRGRTFEDWLAGLGGDRRTVNFVHLQLPHVPYEFYPDGRRYAAGLLENDGLRDKQGRTPDDETVQTLLEQRLLLQTGFVDHLLGQVIERLKREGIWEEAIVAITSDHGVSFRAGQPRRVPKERNFSDIASVPLIVKGPGVPRGRVDRRLARTSDMLPTIADILGVTLPFEVQGSSLLAAPPEDRTGYRIEDRFQRERVRSAAEFERERDALLAEKVRLFGSNAGWPRVYRFGPYGNLVGRMVGQLPPAPERPVTITLARPEAFAEVNPLGRFVPGAIRIRFSGLGIGEPVAVAINGRVAAVTATYDQGEGIGAFAVVPPTAFRGGANEVEVYAIEPGSPPRLSPLGGTSGP